MAEKTVTIKDYWVLLDGPEDETFVKGEDGAWHYAVGTYFVDDEEGGKILDALHAAQTRLAKAEGVLMRYADPRQRLHNVSFESMARRYFKEKGSE